MRVLVVSHTYVARINQAKLEALADQGVELGLVVPTSWKDTLRTVPLELPPRPPFSPFPCAIGFNGNGRRYFYSPLGLWRAFRAFRPHLIHVEEEPDSLALLQAAILSRVFRCRLTFFSWENIYRRAKLPTLEAFNNGSAQGAIAGSEGARDVLRRKGFRRPVAVIPQLGVDPDQFRLQDGSALRRYLGLRPPVFGYVGRLVAEKGLSTLLAALAGLEGAWSLLVVGDGPWRASLEAQARLLGVEDRLVLHSPVSHEEVPKYLNVLDALVLPSLTTPTWKEQFGHIIIEAMACGVAVIGSDSGAIPDVIGDAGLIHREGDALKLREGLAQLAGDEGLRQELAQKGRERVLGLYTHEKVAAATVQFWREILKQ